jgi:hypothetical protein
MRRRVIPCANLLRDRLLAAAGWTSSADMDTHGGVLLRCRPFAGICAISSVGGAINGIRPCSSRARSPGRESLRRPTRRFLGTILRVCIVSCPMRESSFCCETPWSGHGRKPCYKSATDICRTTRELWPGISEAKSHEAEAITSAFHPHDVLRRLCAFLGIDEDASWPYLHVPVYRRSHTAMPLDNAADLAGLYRDRTAALAERFGGFAEWWHYCCERLTERANDREITFPFYESRLWTEWSSGFVPSIQSDILTRWGDTNR